MMTFNIDKDEIIAQIRELLRYGIAGVITTIINILVYLFFADFIGINYIVANGIAWIASFAFAFVSNKSWVFQRHKRTSEGETGKELIGFFAVRIFTMILDMFMMWAFVGLLSWDGGISKVIDNIVVIIVNWVGSKFFVFGSLTKGRQRLYTAQENNSKDSDGE